MKGRMLRMVAPGRIDPLECRDLLVSLKQQISYYDTLCQILYIKKNV